MVSPTDSISVVVIHRGIFWKYLNYHIASYIVEFTVYKVCVESKYISVKHNNNDNLYSASIRHVAAFMALLHIKHHVKIILLMPIKRPF